MKVFPQSILFCRQDRMGDLILSLPLAAAVKKSHPEIRVGFLVNDGLGVIAEACREIDEVWEAAPTTKLDKIRLKSWDAAVVLWPNRKLASQLFWARVSRRIGTGRRGYSYYFNERVSLHRHSSGKHETELNFDLLDSLFSSDRKARPTFALDEEAMSSVVKLFESHQIAPIRRIAILHPGSGGSSRDWPLAHFEWIADLLSKRSDTHVILSGSREERRLTTQIAKINPEKILSVAGETTLSQLMSLLSLAGLCIANSTGPLHLANALKVPTIGLFPPLIDCGPERWGVLDHPEWSLLPEFPDVECPFCKQHSCNKGECMGLISPERVLELGEPLLGAMPSWSEKYAAICAGH